MNQAAAISPTGFSQPHAGAAATEEDIRDLATLIQQRVWLHARRRRAWLETLRHNKSTPESAEFFEDADDRARERRWQDGGEGSSWSEQIRRLDALLAGPNGKPLEILARTFTLSRAEMDLLQSCLVQQLDPALGPALAYLHGQTNSAFVSGPAVARLFGHDSQSFAHPLANVRRWKLVQPRDVSPGEPTAFEADPMLAPWIEGSLILDPGLPHLVRRIPVHKPPAGWPVEKIVRTLGQGSESGEFRRLVISGAPQSGRSTLAAAACDHLGMVSIGVDTDLISDQDWENVFLEVQRFAILGGFAVVWKVAGNARRWPWHVETSPVQIVVCETGTDVAMPGWTDVHFELGPPSIRERHTLWKNACSGFAGWPEDQRDALTKRYQLSVGQIAAIARRKPEDGAQAIDLARESTRTDIGNLGQFLSCPFTWDDIVLPESLLGSLRDLSYEAATRAEFWEQPNARRLFPRGRGLTALLSGTPGTGKTMAAQVIAAELQMDLFRIDIARVVSKYIGDTAKHLAEVFSRASRMSAILLFDEADALFAKRTQVKDSLDRHANSDTSYLLQLLDEFQGLALLTTNKRGNIDPAFYRRLRYVYEFPKPGPEDRLLIWQRLTAELHGETVCTKVRRSLEVLAREVEISAAQIKNTLLAAAFIARRRGATIGATQVVKALERELSKEGRALGAHIRNQLT